MAAPNSLAMIFLPMIVAIIVFWRKVATGVISDCTHTVECGAMRHSYSAKRTLFLKSFIIALIIGYYAGYFVFGFLCLRNQWFEDQMGVFIFINFAWILLPEIGLFPTIAKAMVADPEGQDPN